MINLNSKQLKCINTLIMKTTRIVIGYKSYFWSNMKVMTELNWLNGAHSIYYATLNYIHSINYNNTPEAITSLLEYPTKSTTRYVRTPRVIYKTTSQLTKESLLYKSVLIYKNLPNTLKTMNCKMFKNEVKHFIRSKLPPDRIVGQNDFT